MKGKTVIRGMVVVCILFAATAWAGTTVPVSPSGGVVQNCPTFSWSASERAQSYRIEVYEQITGAAVERDSMSLIAAPVVTKEIPAPALSWSASSGECLPRGMRYVWYVRGEDAEGKGKWSEGTGFEVEASVLSVEQQEEVKEVVREELKAAGSPGSTDSVADATTVRSASIVPQALPPVIDAYGDTTNTLLGVSAGANLNLSAVRYDTFIGAGAGTSTTTGQSNVFVGYLAGYPNKNGSYNAFVGRSAGYYNDSGYYNTSIGAFAGFSNSIGNRNVFLGYEAGYGETGSNKLYIDNCFAAGCNKPLIYGEFDNRLVKIDGRLEIVTVATPSDIRYKKDIHRLDSPLGKVLKLEGVTYEWDTDKVKGAGFEGGRQIGLIAQEVEKVLPELVHTDGKGYKSLSYDKLGPVLIEAVKEQQREISAQQKEIAEKDARIERLEKELDEQKKSLALQQATISAIIARLAAIEHPGKTLALK